MGAALSSGRLAGLVRREPGHIPRGARSVSLQDVAQDANAATPGLD